jgi:hypothetical protein
LAGADAGAGEFLKRGACVAGSEIFFESDDLDTGIDAAACKAAKVIETTIARNAPEFLMITFQSLDPDFELFL